MNYIDTEHYYEEISSLTNEVINEIEDNLLIECENNEFLLNEGNPILIGGKKRVKLCLKDIGYGDEVVVVNENGEYEMVRELSINAVLDLAECMNNAGEIPF